MSRKRKKGLTSKTAARISKFNNLFKKDQTDPSHTSTESKQVEIDAKQGNKARHQTSRTHQPHSDRRQHK